MIHTRDRVGARQACLPGGATVERMHVQVGAVILDSGQIESTRARSTLVNMQDEEEHTTYLFHQVGERGPRQLWTGAE